MRPSDLCCPTCCQAPKGPHQRLDITPNGQQACPECRYVYVPGRKSA